MVAISRLGFHCYYCTLLSFQSCLSGIFRVLIPTTTQQLPRGTIARLSESTIIQKCSIQAQTLRRPELLWRPRPRQIRIFAALQLTASALHAPALAVPPACVDLVPKPCLIAPSTLPPYQTPLPLPPCPHPLPRCRSFPRQHHTHCR